MAHDTINQPGPSEDSNVTEQTTTSADTSVETPDTDSNVADLTEAEPEPRQTAEEILDDNAKLKEK